MRVNRFCAKYFVESTPFLDVLWVQCTQNVSRIVVHGSKLTLATSQMLIHFVASWWPLPTWYSMAWVNNFPPEDFDHMVTTTIKTRVKLLTLPYCINYNLLHKFHPNISQSSLWKSALKMSGSNLIKMGNKVLQYLYHVYISMISIYHFWLHKADIL